jgi:chaperonin cofactor prefoldin
MLVDPSVYSNPQQVKDRNSEYQQTKEKLESTINEWEKYSEELHKIEKQFS